MTMISSVGRKHAPVRMLIAFMYLILILGGCSMVYPFMLMVAGSTKSGVDIREVSWLPAFLVDSDALYRKHVESLFNEQLDTMRSVYDSEVPSFERVEPPATIRIELVNAWNTFSAGEDIPELSYTIGYMRAHVSRTVPMHLRRFKKQLMETFDQDIGAANRALETEYVGWNAFFLLPEDGFMRRSKPMDTPLGEAWRRYRDAVPHGYRYYFTIEGFYKTQFLKTRFTRNIDEYNKHHGTSYASYDDISLSTRLPRGTEAEQATWEQFVRNSLHLEWVRVDEAAAPLYRNYLKARYGTLDRLNRQYGTQWMQWSEIPLIQAAPWSGLARSDWASFIAGWRDPDTDIFYQPVGEQLSIDGIDQLFREYLQERWGDLASVNRALDTEFASWRNVLPPQREAHYASFLAMQDSIRSEFIWRNFITALDHLAFHGRGIRNTVIYCVLAVLSALLINPLAAYAMSRYKPPTSYKLLLFLLLTMAFPPMVTQIPVFLMMRDLNLLNTFAALLLPGLAHGYSIFLLKGFFDALPRELYETASIDGAGEWTMFWQITMSLSKPILAVVALQAFTVAYSNFMYALLICQDEKMWTMMVWLYQLQMRSGPGVVYASLIIAAIPTLFIFIFCQNIILRGIVVPVEK